MSVSSDPERIRVLDSGIFFLANDGITGVEPWVTDGTAAGTRLLMDLDPTNNGEDSFSLIDGAFEALGGVFFSGLNELYFTEGTSMGTRRIGIESAFLDSVLDLGSSVLLEDSDDALYVSAGTSDSTRPIRTQPTTSASDEGSSPRDFAASQSLAAFRADEDFAEVTFAVDPAGRMQRVAAPLVDGFPGDVFGVAGSRVIFSGFSGGLDSVDVGAGTVSIRSGGFASDPVTLGDLLVFRLDNELLSTGWHTGWNQGADAEFARCVQRALSGSWRHAVRSWIGGRCV